MTEPLLLSGASEASRERRAWGGGGSDRLNHISHKDRLPGSQLILLKKKKVFYDKTLSARLFKESGRQIRSTSHCGGPNFFAQNVVMFPHLMWHFDKKKENPVHFKCGSIQTDNARHEKTF